MKKTHSLHTKYNSILYKLGLQTSLLYSIFALPLTISFALCCICMIMVPYPLVRAYGIGVLLSCLALIAGIRLALGIMHKTRSFLITLLLSHCKVLAIALMLVLCYSFFQLSIFALLFGFTTPLCIITLRICRAYLIKTTVKEL